MKKIQEELLVKAFDFYAVQKVKALPCDKALASISFSAYFEAKMQRLITKQKKSWFYFVNTAAKKIAIIILTIIIGITATTFSVESLRQTAIEFITQVYEKFTRIIFVDDTSQNDVDLNSTSAFKPLFPDYIPEGFELSDSMDLDILVMREYKNDTDRCMYRQRINSGSVMGINTEQKEYNEIFINNIQAFTFTFDNETCITFTDGEYIFSISGTIDINELIKIAESIKIQ